MSRDHRTHSGSALRAKAIALLARAGQRRDVELRENAERLVRTAVLPGGR